MKIELEGKILDIPEGTTLLELSRQYPDSNGDIVLAYVDDHLCELFKAAKEGSVIRFVTTLDNVGYLTYKRSATLLLLKAMNDVIGQENIKKVSVMHSISNGYYCELKSDQITMDEDLLRKIKDQMRLLVEKDMPIHKKSISTSEAFQKFGDYGMFDKEKLFRYRRVSKTNIYSIGNFEDYFYGYMVPSTGYIQCFDLFLFEEGFVLQMPSKTDTKKLSKFRPANKLFGILKESKEWSKTLEVDTVGALNDSIVKGHSNELILIQEALQEKRLGELADKIVKDKKKIILIAGPSSSGKTTFSHRLSIQLRVHGLHPHPIAMDDYFVNREDSPKDEFGEYNFETLASIDVKQFSEDMTNLLAGKRVNMPVYNFVTGKREYKDRYKQLKDDDILVIEGIHGLNQDLTKELPRCSMFKIYISALTQLNIDEHNRIPTTDCRLIRRIVRDARHRGTSARETIARWSSVRKGEEDNIFPYQEEADAMFNSALIYELAVLKQYAEPLLFAIPTNCAEYQEAKRLLKFLDYFLGINSDFIPKNSIIKEFIGGSCFEV